MQNYVITIPDEKTTIKDGDAIVKKNRYLLNLRGAIDIYSAHKPLSESVELITIFKEINLAEKTQTLILPEVSYNKIKHIVAEAKGWGNVEAQVELLEVTNSAVEQNG